MSAGDLHHRLTVERIVEGDDGYGNYQTDDYAALFDVMAKVQAARGGEAVQAARVTSSGRVDVWVRADRQTLQITTADRLVDARSGAVYEIKHIADLAGAGRTLLLTCEGA